MIEKPISGQTDIFAEMSSERRRRAPDVDPLGLAIERVRGCLLAADAGGYGRNGWASYLARWDVEALLAHAESSRA